jgi:nucleoside-diphosphate-sugar epimerase
MLHQGQDPARGNHDGRVLSELILVTGGAGFIGSHLAARQALSNPYGMAELADWLEGQVADDRVDHATAELASRRLTR